MKNNWTKLALISALILNFMSLPAFAAEGQTVKSRGLASESMKMHCETMMKELGITDEQKQKLDLIMSETKTQADPVAKCMMEKKKALMQYIFSSQANKEQAMCKAKEIADLKYQLEGIMINGMFQAKCILTPAQQQKFVELYQNRMMGAYQMHMDLSMLQ
jgi:Spy/CpxP family protein refolding chaperone